MENYTLIHERKNDLFERKEIVFSIKSEINPTHDTVEKFISEKFKTNPDTIKIKSIKGSFGSNLFVIKASIYSSEKEKNETERDKKWETEKKKKIKEAEDKKESKEEAE